MSFRFRKRSGLLGGLLHLNWSKNGLSSISVGPRGATLNFPVNRSGGTRTTVGIPGTGLSWSSEASSSRSVRDRRQQQCQTPQLPSTESIIQDLLNVLVGIDKPGDALWSCGLVQRVLDDPDTPRNVREAAVLIRSADAVELHCRRAKGKAATNRAGMEIINAVQTVLEWTNEQGWSSSAD